MSLADEGPSYYIKDGKIWSHHSGESYTSGGFTDYDSDLELDLCEATQRNINYYASNHGLYSYDTHDWVKPVKSEYKDAFENELFVGDEVYTVKTNYSDRFKGFVKCKIIGFTNKYAKVEITYPVRRLIRHMKRIPHRLILID